MCGAPARLIGDWSTDRGGKIAGDGRSVRSGRWAGKTALMYVYGLGVREHRGNNEMLTNSGSDATHPTPFLLYPSPSPSPLLSHG
ncbi:hypothetical protein PoB_005617200 [Plakobranchus ocellatus]|uniref:Uncharacterized protein n=1 Tax=Plakobranchus ocellatus TaxID=259542 RepID=A0AAV4CDS3_9GAST|nr:hypothetical protein PoB_005617200 [Plakobranchus ocellatus]